MLKSYCSSQKKMNSQFTVALREQHSSKKSGTKWKSQWFPSLSPLHVSKANEESHFEVKVNDYKVVTFFKQRWTFSIPPPPQASWSFFQLCENLAKVAEFALGKERNDKFWKWQTGYVLGLCRNLCSVFMTCHALLFLVTLVDHNSLQCKGLNECSLLENGWLCPVTSLSCLVSIHNLTNPTAQLYTVTYQLSQVTN